MKFDNLLTKFIESMVSEGYKPPTILSYKHTLSQFGNWIEENYPDAYHDHRHLNAEIVNKYLLEYLTCSLTTKREYAKTIRTFSKWLIRTDRKNTDITRKLPSFRPERSKVKWLEEDKIKTSLQKAEKCSERDYLILLLLLQTGLRAGSPTKQMTVKGQTIERKDESFLGIKIKDINFAECQITIGRTKMHPEGQTVYFTTELGKRLKAYVEEQQLLHYGREYLFYNRNGKPLDYAGLRNITQKYAGVSPHKFRHSFGVMMRKAGYDLDVIAKLMNHTNLQMTQQYAEIVDEMAKEEYRDEKNPFLSVI
ncbi:MAG: tyrosine-type recombinase/integrase [Halobacteriota archaeon]|nr:tyrosine-type recombinase/integrase [Halobacteriota archaeon]